MTFGLQNQTIALTPTGYVRSDFLTGADNSDQVVTWNGTTGSNLNAQLGVLQVGTPIAIDLTPYITLPAVAPTTLEFGFANASGDLPRSAGFAISGSGTSADPYKLTNSCVLPVSGSFQIVAITNGATASLSPSLSFTIGSSNAVPDTIAPTTPTSIRATQGTADYSINVVFDAPCDIAPPNSTPSGSAHVDVLVGGSVASPPSPVLTVSNPVGSPTGVNIGNITSPAVPGYNQNGKVWQLSSAGTGIAGTASEQILFLDFGQFTGTFQLVAQLDNYTAGSATNALAGIIIHETAAAGGRLCAVGLGPSDGTTGLKVITRATASAATTTPVTVANDSNGSPIVGPVYVKIIRAADNKTLTISYSLNENGSTAITTQTIVMNATVHVGLFLTSASAGNAVVANIEEVGITTTKQSYNTTVTAVSASAVNIQLRAVDANNNVSDPSPNLSIVPKQPASGGGGNGTKIHPGHGFWLDNHDAWPGTQSSQLNIVLPVIGNTANLFNRVAIIMPWVSISDSTLTSGAQTFTQFRTTLADILGRLRAVTSKKIYLTLKFWQGAFPSQQSGTIASVAGSTATLTPASGSSVGTGWLQCNTGGSLKPVTAISGNSVTITGSWGAVGSTYYLGKMKMPDSSYWPAWMPTNWMKLFFQTNTNAREQLDYDNVAIWNALDEMWAGVFQAIHDLDTDNRVDIVATGDESIAAVVDINGHGICDQTNYNTRFINMHLTMAANTNYKGLIWCPASYMAGTADASANQTLITTLQNAYPAKFGYGGPDTPLFGVHGNVNAWYTTFLNVITGLTGTLGDIRDTVFLVGNTEGPGIGAGTGANCPPPLGTSSNNNFQAIWNDVMTRLAIPVSGSRPAHTGLGCQIMHWVYATRFCMKSSDMISLVNSNNGGTNKLPPGNWDTSP